MAPELHQAFMILLERRQSTRDFRPDAVAEYHLEWLREAVRQAPSAGGDRGVRCFFLTSRNEIKALAEKTQESFAKFCAKVDSPYIKEELEKYAGESGWFAKAPALAVVTARKTPSILQECLGETSEAFFGAVASAAMAVQNMLLAAESLGLGACPLTGPLACAAELEEYLKIDKTHKLAFLVALGHKRQEGEESWAVM